MFRIRKISNPFLSANVRAIEQIKALMKKQFGDVSQEKIDMISDQLVDPLKYRFQAMLFVADSYNGDIKGFALVFHFPDLHFYYLDYLAVLPSKESSGVGGALYQRVREEALSVRSKGLFYECLPDDPALCDDEVLLEQNKKRLAFYEKFEARPVINTKYETPVNPGDSNPPFLVFDGLGINVVLSNKYLKEVVDAILHRKYGDYCPEAYVKMVVDSIQDDPVKIRPFRYQKKKSKNIRQEVPARAAISLFINDQHAIHHVRERGYVEAPVRIQNILKEILPTGIFTEKKSGHYPDYFITRVHDPQYFQYFKNVTQKIAADKSVYPYVFPIRNNARPPKELSVRAGYYCIDTFTPLNKNAFLAARSGADSTLTAADEILQGTRAAFVLTRPPGHHAETNVFGGFCYLNNNAIAAEYLSGYGKVAILDIDYHHGNGQQQIFYNRSDVLTISIHGHPSFAYPYFSGFNSEKGVGTGLGHNVNFALAEVITADRYRKTLQQALALIKKFAPDFLIVPVGFDTAKGDPTGTWPLVAKDFYKNGQIIAASGLPTLFVQEGGYRTQNLGKNARAFFLGFYEKSYT